MDWQVEQLFDPQGARVGYFSVVSGSGSWLLAYVPFNGRELARYAQSSPYVSFFHPNALGSAWIAHDPMANLLQDAHYYPWGEQWLAPDTPYDAHFAGNHAALQGPELADFTMYDTPTRFYAPNPGRWHSPDPRTKAVSSTILRRGIGMPTRGTIP